MISLAQPDSGNMDRERNLSNDFYRAATRKTEQEGSGINILMEPGSGIIIISYSNSFGRRKKN